MKPLLFLDVDGPLNPYGALSAPAPPEGFHPHRMRPAGWSWPEPLTVLLDPDHGTRLRALQRHYELVWATTWEDEANAWIAPVLGLPPLPYVDFPAPAVPGPARDLLEDPPPARLRRRPPVRVGGRRPHGGRRAVGPAPPPGARAAAADRPERGPAGGRLRPAGAVGGRGLTPRVSVRAGSVRTGRWSR
ncbi:hypothetical protein ACFQVA_05280 [Actinomadura keratinilytica]